MNITFNTLSLRNFLSYGNNITTIELSKPGTTLIIGEDLDDTTEGVGGNGVGKTTILNALTYAIYDKPVSSISKDNLVNNINKKNMEVVIVFNVGDISYKIKRERKSKAGAAGNNVYFWVDGIDKTLDSVANTNTAIELAIGIPYELFVRIVVFSASLEPFLDLPKAAQAEMFEVLVGVTTLSNKAAEQKDIIKENETAIKFLKVKIDLLEQEHKRHDIQILHARERMEKWVITNNQSIKSCQLQLDQISGVDLDHQQSLHEELATLNTQLAKELRLFESIESNLLVHTRNLAKYQKELMHLTDNKCPYCLQSFADTKSKINELEELVSKINEEILQHTQNLTMVDGIVSELESTHDTITKQLTTPNIKDLLIIKSQSASIEANIESLSIADNPHIDSWKELTSTILDPIDYTEINKLTREIEHQKLLLKLLTKRDSFVRKELLNKYIPYLNSRLQYYLSELGLRHTVEFTHEMTAKISQFGRTLDFGNLSAGQRARVNLALSLSFSDVLQKLHSTINIQLFDEVLDIGLDAVGIQLAAKLLKQKAKTEESSMYIISHRDEVGSMFDHKMIIQLIKGFSYIKQVEVS